MDIKLLTQVEKESIGERQPLPEQYLRLSDDEMDARIAEAKRTLGERVVILGHHYQRDEVIKFADYTGDSLKLSRAAASRGKAEFIVFCGVHFMAESADILRAPHQKVVLPDLAAGCSMADMAAPDQLEICWRELNEMGVDTAGTPERAGVIPVTYINSSAAIKAFVGAHGGIVCTSTNAAAVMKWAWERGEKLVMLPGSASRPQHRLQDGRAARRDGGVGSRTRSGAGSTPEQVQAREADSVEGALLGPHALHRAADRRVPEAVSARQGHRASGVHVRRRPGGGRERLDRADHQRRPRQPGRQRLGGRHRSASGQPADPRGRAGPDGHHPRPVRLPVLDDVPGVAESSALDAREPRRRARSRTRSSSPSRRRARPGSRSTACSGCNTESTELTRARSLTRRRGFTEDARRSRDG